MVRFNRRFAPHVVRMKELLGKSTEPKAIIVTVNAGSVPAEHWTQDHLARSAAVASSAKPATSSTSARFLAGSPIISVDGCE